jgi:hypothetical protein
MLIEDIEALLNLYGEKIAQDIRNKMSEDGTVATGASNASLDYDAEGGNLRITGNEGIAVVSEGRPAGRFPNIQNIKDWIAAKGITPNASTIRPRDLAYVIARAIYQNGSIKRFGYKGSGLLDYVINKNNEPLTQDLADLGLEYLDAELVGQFTKSKDITIR